MRFLSCLFRSKPRLAPSASAAHTVGRSDSSGERFNAARSASAQRRGDAPAREETVQVQQAERAERRELLYGVVRETMMRAGVLSTSYKFKVLSTGVRGHQFLVMIDMTHEMTHTGRWNEMEMLMAQAAKARYDINVTGVYWRFNRQATSTTAPVPLMTRRTPPAPILTPVMAAVPRQRPAPISAPIPIDVPVDERTTEPAALTVMDRPGSGRPLSRYEPIEADEVAAFKRALAGAGEGSAAPASGSLQRSGARNPTPMGFEDTQIPGGDRAPGLSATQYGELN